MITPFPTIASILSPEALIKDVLPGFGVGPVSTANSSQADSTIPTGLKPTMVVPTTCAPTASTGVCWSMSDMSWMCSIISKARAFPPPGQYPTKMAILFAPYLPRREVVSWLSSPKHPDRRFPTPKTPQKPHGNMDGPSPICTTHSMISPAHTHAFAWISPTLSINLSTTFSRSSPTARVIGSFLQHYAETLRQRILAMPAEMLEQGACHGDLQGYHANVAPDGTLTFFDFDCGGFGYRSYDLAVFLWCCRLEDAVATRWKPFLESYQETRSIHQRDVQAVPLFVCARYLWHMGVHTQNSSDWGVDFLNDSYFNSHFEDLRQAEIDYL